ncbi:MAG: hypothetical protein NW200_06505 [Hyphomonadaceae bacterium]|nr:hypothetical protein [Hyphomonadaceae bacterium]
MHRLLLAAALFAATPSVGAVAAAQEACVRPAPPAFPAPADAGALTRPDIEGHRAVRDGYFTAADANLACLDRQIDARMKTLFATGAPMDAGLRALGAAHEDASRERAQVYERFLRLCLAWEDARQTTLAGGCATAR